MKWSGSAGGGSGGVSCCSVTVKRHESSDLDLFTIIHEGLASSTRRHTYNRVSRYAGSRGCAARGLVTWGGAVNSGDNRASDDWSGPCSLCCC